MNAFLLCLLISCGALSEPQAGTSPGPAPVLDEAEQRLVLSQLYELKACRQETATYRDYVSREQEQDLREKQNADRALELEKKATEIMQQDRDLERAKAQTWKELYDSVTKKPGLGCRILKAVPILGALVRCH